MKSIHPKNVSAQLYYEARGNPPSAHPRSAVGNFFPGLEFNFLNVWKRVFVGIELLESQPVVIAVDPGAPEAVAQIRPGDYLVMVDVELNDENEIVAGTPTLQTIIGPGTDSEGNPTGDQELGIAPLEWGNLLAGIHRAHGGTGNAIKCIFQRGAGPDGIVFIAELEVRLLVDEDTAFISDSANVPGELTESLCSPWQTDFIGCACYYWAANRPDYINTWQEGSDEGGHNWLNQSRVEAPAPGGGDPRPMYTLRPENLLQHEDVMKDWETKLRFVVRGRDYDE